MWLILAGRGWGKTLTGAHWLLAESGRVPRVAVVAATYGDGRDTAIAGESGLLAACPDLDWNPSTGNMRFPSGCHGKLFSAERPDRLRGPNNYAYWADELGSWQYQQETWDQLLLTTRKGAARGVITTTPRPTTLIKHLIADPDAFVTRGRTDENRANLSPAFMRTVVARYAGTRTGRQELDAELLGDVEGALWRREWLDAARVTTIPPLTRVVVAVDPSTSATGGGDACGIVVAGVSADGQGYVLADYTLNGSPLAWATAAVAAYHTHHADALIAEANNGGALVQVNIGRIAGAPPVKLVHASRGKHARAEPIANLDEQGRIHHVGILGQMEDEMCGWVAGEGDSPNRCFVAGTRIRTSTGNAPIEAIHPGMLVATRRGYRPVLGAGMTQSAARVCTVRLSTGGMLTGTADHPIWTEGRGFVPMDALVWDDVLLPWTPPRPSSGKAVRARGLSDAGIAPVYNLQVAGFPEYFANGILVHNCDARVWALSELQISTGRIMAWA